MTFLAQITWNKDDSRKEKCRNKSWTKKWMKLKRIIHDPRLRRECSLSWVESPKIVLEISSCGQDETPSNPFLLVGDNLQTNGYWLPLSYTSNVNS